MATKDTTPGAIIFRQYAAGVRERAYHRGDTAELRRARELTRYADRALKGGVARKRRHTPVPTPSVAGRLVKAVDERRFGLFVAYSPNKLPVRGADGKIDVASPDVLERACWRFALNGLKVGVGHKPGGEKAARVVENFVHRGAPWHVIGPDGTEQVVEPGDWCVGLIFSRTAWEQFKAGKWGGVSLQGTAKRKAASAETLARQRR